jgi:divalent metal cation (Fe/Co/Zn/Cd) transporter
MQVSYGRIETLSGFANGIFLILISIFIVFEAIQRMYVFFYHPTRCHLLKHTFAQPGTPGDEHEPAPPS